MTGFVHLHVHSEYSLKDSVVRIEPPKRKGGGQGSTLSQRAAQLQMGALALTDFNNLFAWVKFYKACEKEGVKPIAGADVQVRDDSGESEHVTLLVLNETGYRNLSALLSVAYAEGQIGDEVGISREQLAERRAGLLVLLGQHTHVGRALINDDPDRALAALAYWQQHFGEDRCLYLEITRCDRPNDETHCQAAQYLAAFTGLPLVATNDVCFLAAEDYVAHEARVCIAQGLTLDDGQRPRIYTEAQYLKSPEDMAELFADVPEALENSVEIAKRCTLSMTFGQYKLPDYPVPDGFDTPQYLQHQAKTGLSQRLARLPYPTDAGVYEERLAFELGVIERMGFAGYFLVVADFIDWAKKNGCPVGPGRGSGAGSLVAYALGITDLDPLPYNLLFERFLNPARVSMPDFDVDFCMDNRDRVIEYVSEKYGKPHVGQIITYATMAARGVIRDVTRVLGLSYGFGNDLAKLIPATPGATLADALDTVPEMKRRYDEEDETKNLIDLALALEGITRGVGKHAGGVVIAPEPLVHYTPLYCESNGAAHVTQFDMKDLENLGLVKFDFLGLKTLTIIEEALQTIEKQQGLRIDPLQIPLNDPEAYRLYSDGTTSAVFQMESPGMQRASQDLKPDGFEDIIALVSLYRPGPMELIPTYVRRKHGLESTEYLHPRLEPLLNNTFGIFVYQEQVMQVSQALAGYSLGEADMLRRAMGKKNAVEMAKNRDIFVKGAIEREVEGDLAGKIFDQMESFANYGFNKSHAAAYALVSYQTAWLKAHYPAEFMAAVLSCEMQDTEFLVSLLDECKRMKLSVVAPDVNRCFLRFSVEKGAVLYGLAAIKGVGEGAVRHVVEVRGRTPFQDLFDFCQRIDTRRVNKKVLEGLIFSGAMDGFGQTRATLHKTLPKALLWAEKSQASADSGQDDLFGLGAAKTLEKPSYDLASEWGLSDKSQKERETLGFYLSAHPIEANKALINAVSSHRLAEWVPQLLAAPAQGWQPRQKALFGAWVSDIRFFKADKSKGDKGRASYKITLNDGEVAVSTWVDAEPWAAYSQRVKVDSLIFVCADVALAPAKDNRPADVRLYNPEFFAPEQIIRDYGTRLELDLRGRFSLKEAETLSQLLKNTPQGTVAVALHYRNALAEGWLDVRQKIQVEADLLDRLNDWLGSDRVQLRYRKYQAPISRAPRDSKRFEAAFDE